MSPKGIIHVWTESQGFFNPGDRNWTPEERALLGRLSEIICGPRGVSVPITGEGGERAPMERALDRVRAGEDDPPCRSCGGILKSATISFGQNLVPDDLERSERAVNECDLLLAVGSSLTVFPAAALVPLARAGGARIVIVNAEPTPFDDIADAVLRGSISVVLPAIVG